MLDSNKAKNQIHVLYCDYGNDDIVPIEHFMQIATSLWSLLPQAIPVRLHGRNCSLYVSCVLFLFCQKWPKNKVCHLVNSQDARA